MTSSTTSPIGAVAAGHAETADAGCRALERGGNAVDAVVAMVFAACVAEGTLTSLGGGGFIMVAPPEQPPVLVDCFVRQPGLGSVDRELAGWHLYELPLDGTVLRFGTGPASVAIPTLPLGLARVSERYGRLLLSACAEPALELASDGVVLTRTQASEHADLFDLLVRTEYGRSIYEHGDAPRQPGAAFHQRELADSIERLAATGGRDLYEGSLARRLLEWSRDRGGRITESDLAMCDAIDREPLVRDLPTGHRLWTNPVPSMGGDVLVRLFDRLAVDPDVPRALVDTLRRLRPPRTVPPVAGEAVFIPDLQRDLHTTVGDLIELSRSPSTTQTCAIDADGWVASATTTVGFGSGEFIPGSGIQLNNILAEYGHRTWRPAGATVPSMMSPSIVHGGDVNIAIGSAGSDRIPQAIAQVLMRMLESDEGIVDAVSGPRWAYDGERLHCEPGLTEDTTSLAQVLGCPVTAWPNLDGYFGTVNAVAARGSRVDAMGDVRREGVGLIL